MSHTMSGHSFGNVKDARGRTLSVGLKHPKNSTKGIDVQRYINYKPPDAVHWVKDPLTFLAQHVVGALRLLAVLTTPYPGSPDTPIYDSCMNHMYISAVQHGYTVTTTDPTRKIHKNNQITKANKAFARSIVEIVSLCLLYNQRKGWSGVSERTKTTSPEDARALEAIQVILLHQMATAHPEATAALFPGTFPILVLPSHETTLILVCCCHTFIGGVTVFRKTEEPIIAARHHLMLKAKDAIEVGIITSMAGLKAFPKAMWVHHYFIWSCIDDKSRQRLAKHPRTTDLKAPNIRDKHLPGAFAWPFFVRHICTGDERHGIVAVPHHDIPKAVRRHCFQWNGFPITVDMDESDSMDDDFADSD